MKSVDNLITKRRTNIIKYANDFLPLPKDVARIISEYDYYLEGKSYTFSNYTKTPSDYDDFINIVSVLPDGPTGCGFAAERVISGSDNNILKIWNVKTGECEIVLEGHISNNMTNIIKCIIVLSDRQIITGSTDSTLKLWDIHTGKCIATFVGHARTVQCATLLSNRKIVSGSFDETLKLWDTHMEYHDNNITFARYHASDISKTVNCERTFAGHTDKISCVIALPDGRFISGSCDNTLKIWDSENENYCVTLVEHSYSDIITCIALLNNEYIVSGSTDSTLKLWNVNKNIPQTEKCYISCDITLKGHLSAITCISVLQDGRIVSGSADKSLKVWNVLLQKEELNLEGHTDEINCCAMLPDGRIISGSFDNALKIWNVQNGKCEITLEGHSGCINCCTILPDGRIISGSQDNTLKLWS
jgi:WD40 repeat protein